MTPCRPRDVSVSRPANTWSTEDIRLLRQLAIDGAPLEVIAVTLRRTRSAIRNKASMHGVSLRRSGGVTVSPKGG